MQERQTVEMSDHDNKAVVLDYINAFNRGDLDGVCRTFAASAEIHGGFGSGGLEVARPIWEQLFTCFRAKRQVESRSEEGDVVAARYTERGAFSAPFQGIDPTGKGYEITAMEWFVLDQGRIVHCWGVRDSASMFKQMGLPLVPRDETFRRIGRNVVNFQKLEAGLKHLISISQVHGKPEELKAHSAKRFESVRKQPLGPVVERYLGECQAEEVTSPEGKDADGFWVSFGIRMKGDEAWLKKRQQALADLVAERNALIHHDLAERDFNSDECCTELMGVLEEQNARILKELDALKGMFEGVGKIREYLNSDECRKQLKRELGGGD
jgi:hypothetical protein